MLPVTLPDTLRRAAASGPVVGVVAGSGLVARCAVAAGADLLFALSAGLYRDLGVGSLASFLPYGNSNRDSLDLLRREILPRSGAVPVVAGVLGHDPELELDAHLAQLRALGVQGVANWPAVGFIDGAFRQALEAEGLGLERERELFAAAARHGLSRCAFALSAEDALRFAGDGCEILILNLGLTRDEGDIPTRRDRVQQAIANLNHMSRSVTDRGHQPLMLAFGGPVTGGRDLDDLFRYGIVHGFAGGSAFDRLPVEQAITSTLRSCKAIARRHHRVAEAGLDEMVGDSPAIRSCFELIRRVAPTRVSVLIEGETGVGKELAASAIHRLSERRHGPFVTVNCGALPDSLIESEFFGHEQGAFSGADRRRSGKFELADGGTLFLDEVGDLSLHAQVALLRALQAREVTPVGGNHAIPVDVRVIAAGNRELRALVAAGRFRADLYYRLDQIALRIPPLRERVGDIPLLVAHVLLQLEAEFERRIAGVSPRFLEALCAHAWPGNIRELIHVLTRAVLLEDEAILHGSSVLPLGGGGLQQAPPLDDRRQRAHRAVASCDGNKAAAARQLGVSRKTLYQWLEA